MVQSEPNLEVLLETLVGFWDGGFSFTGDDDETRG